MEQNARPRDKWGPRRLPVLHVDGRPYFVDLRLQELRATDDPFTRIDLRSEQVKAIVVAWKAIYCPTCGQYSIIRRDDPAEVFRCSRCWSTVVVQGGEVLAWSDPGDARW